MLSESMHRSWIFTLLSFFTTAERAWAIEGDLLEESQSLGKFWLFKQVNLTVIALFVHSFTRAPIVILLLAMVGLVLSSAFTMFLLFPFVFRFSTFGVFVMLFVICSFRAMACFIVGAAMVEYSVKLGGRAVLSAAILMLIILLVRLSLEYQHWGMLGNVMLGPQESVVFYIVCSMLPIISGAIYAQRNKQGRLIGACAAV